MGAPMRSKASRWVLVGSASIGMVWLVPAKRIWLRVKVARWSRSPRKLRWGRPYSSCWREALAWAAAERLAGSTGAAGGGGVLSGEGGGGPGAGRGPGGGPAGLEDNHVGLAPAFGPGPRGRR